MVAGTPENELATYGNMGLDTKDTAVGQKNYKNKMGPFLAPKWALTQISLWFKVILWYLKFYSPYKLLLLTAIIL